MKPMGAVPDGVRRDMGVKLVGAASDSVRRNTGDAVLHEEW